MSTLRELVAALGKQNHNKTASEKQADAMPPAETVHKTPVNQPAGPGHELAATLGDGPGDRRVELKDQLMQAAGAQKTDESREDPDETHNVSIESKADELMPPAGNAGGEYQGPMTAESKISTDAAALADEYEKIALSVAETGDEQLAKAYAEKAAAYHDMAKSHKAPKGMKGKEAPKGMKGMPPDYKSHMPEKKKATDLVNQILGRVTADDAETVKQAETEQEEHLLKIASEYYHAGRIFGQGALDAMHEGSGQPPEDAAPASKEAADLREQVTELQEGFATLVASLSGEEE